jgi:hypothetical protein
LSESGTEAQPTDQQADSVELNLSLILKSDAIRAIHALKAGF